MEISVKDTSAYSDTLTVCKASEYSEAKLKPTKTIAIIFAGGVGQRFGSEIPKQFVKVYGKDIIIHTLEKFQNHPNIDEIYIGCIEEWIPYLKEKLEQYKIDKVPSNGIIEGGNSGQDTIYKILKLASENNSKNSIVLIHDGVRPIVTYEEITNNIETVKEYGSAVTCIPCTSTPVYSEDGTLVTKTIDRRKMFNGVAPQSFRLGHIIEAHDKIRENDPNYEGVYNGTNIVDSASLVTAAFSEQCHIVIGNPNNMKVTNMYDFFSLLGILQSSDIANYFEAQSNSNFVPNDAMSYARMLADKQEKVKKIGGKNNDNE